MALAKTLVPLSLGLGGLETKTDAKQLPIGKFLRAENIIYETIGAVRKRNGYDSVDLIDTAGDLIEDARALVKFKGELNLLSTTKLYTYSNTLQKFQEKGPIYSVFPTSSPVIRNTYNYDQADSIVVDNLKIYAYHNSSLNEVRYSVLDVNNDVILVSGKLVSASAYQPKLAVIDSKVYIVYCVANTIRFKSITTAQPESLNAETTAATNLNGSNPKYDVAFGNRSGIKRVFVAYNSTVPDIKYFSINDNDLVSSIFTISGQNANGAINLYVSTDAYVIIGFSNNTAYRYAIYPFTLGATPLLVTTTIEALAGVVNCSIIDNGMQTYHTVYEVSNKATAVWETTTPIILTSVAAGAARNGTTYTLSIAAAAANPTDTVLASFTGTSSAITLQITPNNGTNNGGTPVNLTTEEVAELINTGAVVGKTVTVTDGSSLRALTTATGGNTTNVVDGGEGDGLVATFVDGDNYPQVKQATLDFVGNVTAISTVAKSVGLFAKHFFAENQIYVPTVFGSTLQSTYFLLDLNGVTVAKLAPGLAAGRITTGTLTQVSQIDSTLLHVATQIKSRSVSENGTFFSLFGVQGSELDFEAKEQYQSSELGDNLHIAGGVLQMYDGDSVVEHGFNVYPETIQAGNTAITGGSMSDGNYGYVALYAWTDNFGQTHRSIESNVLEVVLSGGGTTQTQSIVIPTLQLTNKQNVVIEVYRTEDNGSIYYKVSSVNSPLFNDKSVNTLTFVDTVSDTALISREVLYTTGGVLENAPGPAAKFIATHSASDRLVIAGLEDPNLVAFSKQHSSGFAVEFNEVLTKSIDPLGGPISALGIMDEKIIVFKNDAIFYFSGTGPNNLGEQDTFTDVERVSAEIGCLDANSIVLIPQGLMFRSRKGIYLLTRGMGLEYLGSPVEGFNDLTITSAKVVGQFNQVRFTTATGDCLVYNYFLNLWATFTNHAAKSAEVLDDQYYYLRQDAALFQENPNVFADNGTPIKLLFETGWITVSQLQGFGRVYKFLFLGEYFSPHKLRINVAYNFNNVYVQEKLIDTADFVTESVYGQSSPYGAEPLYGGEARIYQARVDMEQQKCQAFKLLIQDEQETVGQALSLSALTLQVGGKAGTFKVNSNRKYGTS